MTSVAFVLAFSFSLSPSLLSVHRISFNCLYLLRIYMNVMNTIRIIPFHSIHLESHLTRQHIDRKCENKNIEKKNLKRKNKRSWRERERNKLRAVVVHGPQSLYRKIYIVQIYILTVRICFVSHITMCGVDCVRHATHRIYLYYT